MGNTGRILVDITLVGSQVSFVTAYIYFISKNLAEIIHQIQLRSDPDAGYINKWYFGMLCFFIYVPLCLFRNVSKLAVTHLFGDIMIFAALIAIVSYGVVAINDNNGFSTTDLKPINLKLFPDAIGFSVYAYEGIGIILPIQDITANKEQYLSILTYVLCFIFILYIAFSEFCIFSYGEASVSSDPLITASMPQADIIVWIVEILFCFNLVFSYPLMAHPAFIVIEGYLYKGWPKSRFQTFISLQANLCVENSLTT